MNDLYTLEGRELLHQLSDAAESAPLVPWNVYPRPQLRRDSFFCLNGYWDFAVAEKNNLPREYTQKIRVPFCPESQLSTVKRHFQEGTPLHYRRYFTLPEV